MEFVATDRATDCFSCEFFSANATIGVWIGVFRLAIHCFSVVGGDIVLAMLIVVVAVSSAAAPKDTSNTVVVCAHYHQQEKRHWIV